MLVYGTFGWRTAAGRRYHIRTAIALIAMVVLWSVAAFLAGDFRHNSPWRVMCSLVPGVTVSYGAWEFRRYILALDELARRIQLEAIAWTYLTGWVIATLVGGIALAYGGHWNRWWLNPLWFVFLEPVRACFLYYVARRY
jgi:MFS family permease